MPHLPLLRVVPLETIRSHEENDPLRVDRLVGRIEAEGVQGNPMICYSAPEGELILLDGATRTESLKRIGLEHAVVQIVEPESVQLETWHHVVREADPDEVLDSIRARANLMICDGEGAPRVHLHDHETRAVTGVGISPNATLTSLVTSYVGRWHVSRVTDPGAYQVSRSIPDWSAVIEFPTLTLEDVMKAAITDDLLPAGITRFVVHERALRLDFPLGALKGSTSIEDKQDALDELLDERVRNGQVRRYEETVVILDD